MGGNDVFFSDVLKFCGRNFRDDQDCQDNPYKELNSGRDLTLDEFARLRMTLCGGESLLGRRTTLDPGPGRRPVGHS